MSFEPRGKVAVLLAAMREQPEKIVWPADDVARTMEVPKGNLPAYLQAVMTRQMLFRKLENGKSFFSLQPFEASTDAAPAPASSLRSTVQSSPLLRPGSFVLPRMVPPRGETGGGHMIAGENLAKLRRLLAWMPA